MRIATYNIEWFNSLFNNAGKLINDGGWSSRWDVTRAQQTQALGDVFTALDADAVMIIEAPDMSPHRNTVTALENFASAFGLRARSALMGYSNETQQEIAMLYDPDVITAVHDPKGDDEFPRFDQTFAMDLDVDAAPEPIRWSKPPLELAVTGPTGPLRLIGVHAKSKAPHGARNDAEATRISIENRRKQLAQCVWLRGRVESHLAAGEDLIVLGDFNDGPGLDEYEKLFGRSGVEIVLGEGNGTQMFDPHARQALSRRLGAMPTTSRFKRKGEPYLQALLDYIMVSPSLRSKNPKWQIWHPFDHPDCYENEPLRNALLLASDHFPVVLDLSA
ncbi:endonuclease/exonuclease/phosphatase family protein [Yoonia maritima]|uniref:Endonuclease/exonuclease/phosphatase family protein n=1 Tax=Yoonia maritima TaxID=1435347 RepID=A0A2T0W3E6_9RHOB|nr:endonuclease/exonuclease/phosphatase family protein [Yoonia maritima]PRY79723.1 endonuclease/exonuclease/phosphatase family protein [Yoonia maritima]